MSRNKKLVYFQVHKYHQQFILFLGRALVAPTISARLIFLFTSVAYNIQSFFYPTNVIDKFPTKSIELESDTEFELLLMYAIKQIANKYIKNVVVEEVEIPEHMSSAAHAIDDYLNERSQDGWDNNPDVQLPNGAQTVKLDIKQNASDFADIEKWSPLQNWKPLGASWKNVTNVLGSKIKNEILYKFYYDINTVSEKTPLKERAREVLDISRNLSDEQKMTAELWAGSTRLTPPSINYAIAVSVLASNRVSLIKASEFLMLLGVALFEASIIAWDIKYTLLQARPIQMIRMCFADEKIDYYYGKSLCSLWCPFQKISMITPPFPDAISGHTIFSTVAACILTKFFGKYIPSNVIIIPEFLPLISKVLEPNYIKKTPVYLNSITVERNSSEISSMTPAKDCKFRFKSWMDLADSAGISRIYGGIHYQSSNTDSAAVGKLLADEIITYFYK